MVEVYLKLLEQGYYEVKFAFEGLADENVWKRPAEGMLSVGELAGHVAYGEATRLAIEGGEPDAEANGVALTPEPVKCRVNSLLVDLGSIISRGRWNAAFGAAPGDDGGTGLQRVVAGACRKSVAHFKALNPDLESAAKMAGSEWTYGELPGVPGVSHRLSHRTDVFGAPPSGGADAGQLKLALRLTVKHLTRYTLVC